MHVHVSTCTLHEFTFMYSTKVSILWYAYCMHEASHTYIHDM